MPLGTTGKETHDEGRSAGSTAPRKLDISHPTTEFTRQVKLWDKYDESTMCIAVRHIKRYAVLLLVYEAPTNARDSAQLPDYVFDEGERQPRSQKRPKNKVRLSLSACTK